MLMQRLLSTVALLIAVAFGATSAYAFYLFPTGEAGEENYVQFLEDDFWEVLLRPDGQGGYTQIVVDPSDPTGTKIQGGDLFAGVQVVQKTELAPPEGGPEEFNLQTGPTFTGIFLLETLSVTEGQAGLGDGLVDLITFDAVDRLVWEDLFGAGGLIDISSVFNINDLDGMGAELTEGTTILSFLGQDFRDVDATTGDLSTAVSSFVGTGTLQYEFGFTGAPGEFWTARGPDAAFPAVAATDAVSVRLAQNVTRQWAGPDLEAHIYRQTLGDQNFTAASQLQGVGDVKSVAQFTPFSVSGDLDLWIRPVPEPASFALMGLGLLGLAWVMRRRNVAA